VIFSNTLSKFVKLNLLLLRKSFLARRKIPIKPSRHSIIFSVFEVRVFSIF